MNRQERREASALARAQVPSEPGVYSWYRDGRPIYIGKTESLRGRLWENHMGKGPVMTGSALRRNVAEHLGISSANDIKTGAYVPTSEDVSAVNAWLRRCQVAWILCDTPAEALALE